jgi:hypothetical protein
VPGGATSAVRGRAEEGPGGGPEPCARPSGWRDRRSRLALVLLVAVLVVPLVVAVGALREPRWYPDSDLVETELRVRDVGTDHPPLIGLGGRIGDFGPDRGSHPGPLSFWSLAAPYRLLGSSSWALLAAAAALNAVALGLTLWLVHRRAGPGPALGAAVVLAALAHSYGPLVLTTPWNPYLPVLWWVLFLVGVWALLEGDLVALPVVVLAGSFCTQTHISYLGLVGVLGALGAGAMAVWIALRWHDPAPRRRGLAAAATGAVLAAVLWFPPVAEQISGSQGGNLGRVAEHLASPSEETVGPARGVELLVANLNPWDLLTRSVAEGWPLLGGTTRPGTLLLGAWVAAVAAAWRLRHSPLLRLHAVLAVALAVGVVSVSRIFGPLWSYLALWAWGICALLVLAVAWSAGALLARWAPPTAGPAAAAVAVVALVAVTGRHGAEAAGAEAPRPDLSASAAVYVPETVAALEGGAPPGTGRDGRYLVTWSDPVELAARGLTLLNELEREGFDVGAPPDLAVSVTRHRVRTVDEATAHVHLVVGPGVESYGADPAYRRVALHDPTGPDGRAERARLEAEVAAELGAERPELVAVLRDAPGTLRFEPGLRPELLRRVDRMIELGPPLAVFVGPATT